MIVCTGDSKAILRTDILCSDIAWLNDDTLLTLESKSLYRRSLQALDTPEAVVEEQEGLKAISATDGHWVAVGQNTVPFVLFSTDQSFDRIELIEGPAFPRDVALSHDGLFAYVAGGGAYVSKPALVVVDLWRRTVVNTLLEGFDRPVLRISIDQKHNRLAAGRDDGRIFVWHLDVAL